MCIYAWSVHIHGHAYACTHAHTHTCIHTRTYHTHTHTHMHIHTHLLRSLIGPSLISPRTKLIGVPTIGLPAVITLKIPPNQHTSMYSHLHIHTSTHMSVHNAVPILLLTQWGCTALLRAAVNGHAELVRMLKDDFNCSLEEVDIVSVYYSMCDDYS